MWNQLRLGFRFHVLPALWVGVIIFVAAFTMRAVGQKLHHRWWGATSAACMATGIVIYKSRRWDEQMAAVEAYQALAYLQSVKTVNALTKIQLAVDTCQACDADSCNRHAAIREQIGVIRDALNISKSRNRARLALDNTPKEMYRVIPGGKEIHKA